MTVSINIYLPSICLHLGLIEDEEIKIRMLLDTGIAMNYGNMSYHHWVISECSEMVGECIQYGVNTGYEVEQLMADFDIDSSQQPLNHGQIIAVIRYRIPYLINNINPLFISFDLGNDVSLRCVI